MINNKRERGGTSLRRLNTGGTQEELTEIEGMEVKHHGHSGGKKRQREADLGVKQGNRLDFKERLLFCLPGWL